MSDPLEPVLARASSDPAGALDAASWLGPAIDADARAGRFAHWGWSTVIDEHVAGPVLSRVLFDALHARAGIAARWPIGNAGLLHVYGYLLSTVPTPFGLKRERWLGGTLAAAYGLPRTAFVPWMSRSTLLERVTDAAGELCARHTVAEASVAGVPTSLALGRAGSDGAWALAYAVDGRLVTSFAVDSREGILADWHTGAPALRWNAATPPE